MDSLMGTSGTRTRNVFDPGSREPFRLSRSKIDLFLDCPRCFYLDRRKGVDRPDSPPFTLNLAVDALLKKEFDVHRKAGTPHPLMKQYGIDAVPYDHRELETWRSNFKGVEYRHPTGLLICGAPDDIWVAADDALMVVDYKATSTDKPITLESEHRQRYKRQMEIYQWLLRINGFPVSDTGYFLFVNARKDRPVFDGTLLFSTTLVAYQGDDGWVEDAVRGAHECLTADAPPPATPACAWCDYRAASRKVERP